MDKVDFDKAIKLLLENQNLIEVAFGRIEVALKELADGLEQFKGAIAELSIPIPPEEISQSIEEWFAEREKEREIIGPRRRTSEEYRQDVGEALQKFYQNHPDNDPIFNYCLSVPEHIRSLAVAFCQGFGRTPQKDEDSYWRSAWEKQHGIGIDPKDVEGAFFLMEKRGLTIKSPESMTAIAEEARRDRDKQGRKDENIEVIMSDGARRLKS
jgi:hypothetical protein